MQPEFFDRWDFLFYLVEKYIKTLLTKATKLEKLDENCYFCLAAWCQQAPHARKMVFQINFLEANLKLGSICKSRLPANMPINSSYASSYDHDHLITHASCFAFLFASQPRNSFTFKPNNIKLCTISLCHSSFCHSLIHYLGRHYYTIPIIYITLSMIDFQQSEQKIAENALKKQME